MFGVQSGMGLGCEASGAMARGAGRILAPVLCPTQSGPCSQHAHQRLYLNFYVQIGIVF